MIDKDPISIEEQFAEFDRLNPHVYQALIAAARALIAKGIQRFGAKRIYEQVRYECEHTQANLGHYKMSNNYTAHYARKLREDFPEEFGSVIVIKALASEKAAASHA